MNAISQAQEEVIRGEYEYLTYAQYQQLRAELAASQAEVARLKSVYSASFDNCTQLNHELFSARAEIQLLTDTVSHSSDQVVALQVRSTELGNDLTAARAEIEELKNVLRHDYPSDSVCIRMSYLDFHYKRVVSRSDTSFIGRIAEHMSRALDRAVLNAARKEGEG